MLESEGLTRRSFIFFAASAVAGVAVWSTRKPHSVEAKSLDKAPATVQIVMFSDAGQRQELVSVPTTVKTEAEWRHQLSRDSFDVTRMAVTEYPYSGKYWNLQL